MEVIPFKQIRKQKKAELPASTASFEGQTVIITGANGAFGAASAQMIADQKVHTLILACRDMAKGEAVKKTIEDTTKTEPRLRILVWALDLASFESVREFGKQAAGLESLDAVILNAGMFSAKKVMSPEGWELTIQVNYLATMLLALLLLPTMKSSPSNPHAPIMSFIASWSIFPARLTMKPPRATLTALPASAEYLKFLCANKDGNGQQSQYGRSKLLCLYFMKELAARVPASRVILNSQDPGTAWTQVTMNNKESLAQRIAMRFTSRPVEICARTLVHAISQTEETHGRLMVDYDLVSWPRFMTKPKGEKLRQLIWDETRAVLEGYAPEVAAVYASYQATDPTLEK